MFSKVPYRAQPSIEENKAKKETDLVTDITDDKDILAPQQNLMKPAQANVQTKSNQNIEGQTSAAGAGAGALVNNRGPPLKISDFEASLTKQNSAAIQGGSPTSPSKRISSPRKTGENQLKKERSGWGPNSGSSAAATRPNQMKPAGVL